MSNHKLNEPFEKCESCLKFNVGFDNFSNKKIEHQNIDIINDICECYYSKFKIIEIYINNDIDNNFILYGTIKEITKKLIDNIQSYYNTSNFYISSLSENMCSPFSSGNTINLIIPNLINRIFYLNLKTTDFTLNFIPNDNIDIFSKNIKNITYKINNLSFDPNYSLNKKID